MWRKNRKIVRDAGCLTVYNLKKKSKNNPFPEKIPAEEEKGHHGKHKI